MSRRKRKTYSRAEFMEYLDVLDAQVDREKQKANDLQLSLIELPVYGLIPDFYTLLIRKHFISLGYTVFFFRTASFTPSKDTRDILLMRLTW